MKFSKTLSIGVITFASVAFLAACSNNSSTGANKDSKFSAALVTDTGGVDDKSFNQSAWEGMQAWGKKEGLTKGVGGINYFQSQSESDYKTNLNQAVAQKYNVIYGIGFALKTALEEAAKANPNTNFVLIDDVIEGQKNVASVTFADQEGAYLAGIAAAKTTKTKKVGFVGGMSGAVVGRFEAGFVAGVASVDKSIKVNVQYAGSFADAPKGKSIAHAMIADGTDVIYQVAGSTGQGVFSEAKADNSDKASDAADKIWVIGVDRDQKGEGSYTAKDGKTSNFVLISTVKAVGTTVEKINDLAKAGKFPAGGHEIYGLKDGGVKIAYDNASEDVIKALETAQKGIVDKTIEVPEKP